MIMKKLVLSTLVVLASIFSLQAQQEFVFGGGGQLVFSNGTTFGLQARALTGLNDQVGLSGSFTLYLSDGADWAIDLDAHYLKHLFGGDFVTYPFAGLNILNGAGNTDIGINLGLHIHFPLSEMQAYIDPKIVLDNGDPFIVSFGVFF